MGHPLSRCPCVAAAASRSEQQHPRASQPVADNYALATDEQTNERADEHRVERRLLRRGIKHIAPERYIAQYLLCCQHILLPAAAAATGVR